MNEERSEAEFLRDALKWLSALWVLNWSSCELTRTPTSPPDHRLRCSLHLATARGVGATSNEIAEMRTKGAARRELLLGNPATRTALDELEASGVKPEWGEAGDYGFSAAVLTLVIPRESLSQLHRLAAEDAGIVGDVEQREAEGQFQRWLLQNYHPDWEFHRLQSPLTANPYCTERNDFGRNPNSGLIAKLL